MSVTTSRKMAETRIPSTLWPLLILMVLSVAINYVDRGNLSIAAPMLKDELKLSPAQLGLLLSAFFWTYSSFQIVSGWLVDRLNVSWVLAGGFFLWSAATAVTGLVHGIALLVVLRLLLGTGESVAYPCYCKILAGYFEEQQRGLANALIDAGTKVGPALGTLLGGLLMARFGWRPFFTVLGLASMLWLPAWLKWMPRGPIPNVRGAQDVPSVGEILRKRSAWATFAGIFCGNYVWYFLLTWLPFYLVRERHFSMDRMATVGALAYVVTASATILTGWLADRAIASGVSPTKVRKTCTATGLGFSTVILAVVVIPNGPASMAFLMLACVAYGVYASSHWAITQTIAGPAAAGRWTGLQNFIGNWAGIAASALTGFIVGKTGQFFWAFAAVAVIVLTGAFVYLFFLGPVEPTVWHKARVS
jgi:ACS family D-galactonate transporter-like MFS transporter